MLAVIASKEETFLKKAIFLFHISLDLLAFFNKCLKLLNGVENNQYSK